jgi:hypothetical protein
MSGGGYRRDVGPLGLFGSIRRNAISSASPSENFLNDLLRGLGAPPPRENALANLFRSLGTVPPNTNGVGGIFGLAGALQPQPRTSPAPAPIRRKVFFSFHYDDVCRTVQVRNAWRFRPGWSSPSYNFYDESLWEKSRSESEESLKRLIRRGMAGSSVTCILAGTETWLRPYVRYEIAHSLLLKNGLFTVFIHNVRHPQKGIAAPGYDPLSFMGLELRPDGKGRVCERIGDQWYHFDLMKMPVSWPRWLPRPSVGYLHALSFGTQSYDYVLDDGHKNLPLWAQAAATAAGKR